MEYKYYIANGGHRDARRIYPMMEFDFESEELFPEMMLQCGIFKNSLELLLLRRSDGLECGYAVIQTKSSYGYVLIGYLSVYPTMRGKNLGDEFLRLIAERYAHCQGIILEVTIPEGKEDKGEKLCEFYTHNGYRELEIGYRLCDIPSKLMYRRLNGPERIEKAAKCIVSDNYAKIFPRHLVEKRIEFF